MSPRSFALFFLLTPLLCVQAKDLAIKIDYDTTATGTDGVTRITRYSDQLIRRDNDTWLVRVMPAGVHAETDHHQVDKGHKHMDTSTAARWVSRLNDGKLQVRLVNAHDKLVIDVPKTEFANINFDGDWANASQLLGTEQVRKMKPLADAAPAGQRWYEAQRNGLKVRVLWDEQQEFPRKIESTRAQGNYRSTVTVTPQSMPTSLPWTQLKTYQHKEYTDLLD